MVIAKNIVLVSLAIILITPLAFSQEQALTLKPNLRPNDLSELQKQARSYREEGYKQQSLGNLESAVTFYQKAIQLDPSYAVVYNDMGVIYERDGLIDRAEEYYLKALSIDPVFLSAYSNLALLYENKRDLDKAFLAWKKRAELGMPFDPWTQKAQRRMTDLMQVIPGLKEVYNEKEMFALINEAAEKKKTRRQDEIQGSLRHLEAAKRLYNEAEYKLTIEELNASLYLNPQNVEAAKMLEQTRARINERQRIENEKRLHEYFQKGKRYYE